MPATPNADQITTALRAVPDPERTGDLIGSGAVRELKVVDGKVRFMLAMLQPKSEAAAATRARAERAVMGVPGVAEVDIRVVQSAPPASGLPG